MKTGQYYFDLLPKEIQDKIKANIQSCEFNIKNDRCNLDKYMKNVHYNFQVFILSLFEWSKTSEGQNYWDDVSETNYETEKQINHDRQKSTSNATYVNYLLWRIHRM